MIEKIRNVARYFGIPTDLDTPLYGEKGYLDSLKLIEFVVHLEKETGLEIYDTVLAGVEGNPFQSISTLATFLESLGGYKKVLCIDLDGVLWDGVLGEGGAGEPRTKTQEMIFDLYKKGVLLATVSKNNEREAFVELNKSLLKPSYFAAHRINWLPKTDNLKSIAHELSLNLESFVFMDDSASERNLVKSVLPMVTVVDEKADVSVLLRSGGTEEDKMRQKFYKDKKAAMGISNEEWLKRLNTQVHIRPIVEDDKPRVLQLINKTNQMNMRLRRMTPAFFDEWLSKSMGWSVRATDTLGDNGIIGFIGIEPSFDECVLTDFILSCRMIGRGAEEKMWEFIVAEVAKHGIHKITPIVSVSERNVLCREFIKSKICI